MQLWLVLLGSAFLLPWILVHAWFPLECDLKALGEPSGTWAAGIGLGSGPFVLAGVAAPGTQFRSEFHVFGIRIPVGRRRPKATVGTGGREPPPERDVPDASPTRVGPLARQLDRAVQHATLLKRLAGHVRIEPITIDLVYGFRDLALTGRVLGALAALSGVLPASISLTQTPLWDGPERWEARARGRIEVRLGLVLGELLWYMLKQRCEHLRARGQLHG